MCVKAKRGSLVKFTPRKATLWGPQEIFGGAVGDMRRTWLRRQDANRKKIQAEDEGPKRAVEGNVPEKPVAGPGVARRYAAADLTKSRYENRTVKVAETKTRHPSRPSAGF